MRAIDWFTVTMGALAGVCALLLYFSYRATRIDHERDERIRARLAAYKLPPPDTLPDVHPRPLQEADEWAYVWPRRDAVSDEMEEHSA